MEVKKAVPDDAQFLEEINVATWRTAYRGLLPDEWLQKRGVQQQRIDAVRASIESNKHIYLKASVDGKAVGYLVGGKKRDENAPFDFEICAIYVLEEFWSKGVGQALFAEWRKLINHKGFYVYMLKGNDRALKFYLKQGGVCDQKYDKSVTSKEGFVIDEVFVGFSA